MERLTEKHYLGTDHYMKCSGNCDVDMDCIDCPSFDRLVERLAAYEDTGLTPAEVSALVKDWSDRCTIVGECGGIERMRELAEADNLKEQAAWIDPYVTVVLRGRAGGAEYVFGGAPGIQQVVVDAMTGEVRGG